MAHVVVLGAGLGGAIMAYELKDQLRPEDTVTVVTKDPKYHFVPSNPWIAVGWRKRDDITVDLAPTMAKKKINFIPVAAEKLHTERALRVLELEIFHRALVPAENSLRRDELGDHHVEGAELLPMAPEHAFDVIGHCAEALGHALHLDVEPDRRLDRCPHRTTRVAHEADHGVEQHHR